MKNTGSECENKHFQSVTIQQIEAHNQAVRDNKVACTLPPCDGCRVFPDQFTRHELRPRKFYVIIDEVVHIVNALLIRWKCPGCNKTFTQYADFALPYKRYSLPDMMQYARRYLENVKMTYAQLIRIWFAGYQESELDERQLWPSTIHRWLTTLGGFIRLIGKAQSFVHQKDPRIGVTRLLAGLKVSVTKFKTPARAQTLIRCLQLLHLEPIFRRIFDVSIFPKLASACAFL